MNARPSLCLLLALLAAFAAVFWSKSATPRMPSTGGRHPIFGTIHRARMEDPGYDTPLERKLGVAAGILRFFRTRAPPELAIGTNTLTWHDYNEYSQQGEFVAAFTGGGPGLLVESSHAWEFGWCRKPSLLEVTPEDLNPPFKERRYADMPSNSGVGWISNSIRVDTGQVILARPTNARDTVYIVQVDRQDGWRRQGALTVSYVIAAPPTP